MPSSARCTWPGSRTHRRLRNFFERQTYAVKEAPADFEAQLRRSTFSDPVLVVPHDFEAALVRGDAPIVEIVSDSANQRSEASTGRLERLLGGFSRERAVLSLALRGVSPQLLEPIRVDDRDLASTQTRATRITGMLPYFVMMAVLYGALNAALDTTAGERERGSLEPLLMNPAERWALVAGKWGAVPCVSMLIAVLSCFSFLPGQWVLRSDTLGGDVPVRPARGGAVHRSSCCRLRPRSPAVLMAVAIRVGPSRKRRRARAWSCSRCRCCRWSTSSILAARRHGTCGRRRLPRTRS